jgi:hypothetical protein
MIEANQQFPSASILNLFPTKPAVAGTDGAEEERLRVVDSLISITRRSWAEPFDTFGNFAA